MDAGSEKASSDWFQSLPLQNAATGLGQLPHFPMQDWFRPVLVTVSVGEPPREFDIPRPLICEQSVYFAKAFDVRYKEGQERYLRLPTVKRVVFEMFVGWLYTQRIFFDPQRLLLGEFGSDSGSSDSGVVDELRQTTLDTWLLKRDEILSSKRKRDAGDTSQDLEDRELKRARVAETCAGGGIAASPLDSAASPAGWAKEGLVGVEESDLQQTDALGHTLGSEAGSKANNFDAGLVFSDPITWDYESQFEMYAFADEYDTQRLRNTILEIVQVKALQRRPIIYLQPNVDDFAYAFGHLPAASGLYKFLLDFLTYMLSPATLDMSDWETLPSGALAASCLRLKRLEAFRGCPKCYGGMAYPPGTVRCRCHPSAPCDLCKDQNRCDAEAHRGVYTGDPPYFDICQYHEHDTDAERDMCARRWKLVRQERKIATWHSVM